MSTYYSNHAVASACPDVITLPLMEVSNNARAGIARRKVDAMDDGLVKHAGDELARSIKRCRRSCEDIERVHLLLVTRGRPLMRLRRYASPWRTSR